MVQTMQADVGQDKTNLHNHEIPETMSDKDVENCSIEVVLSSETSYGNPTTNAVETPSYTDEEARRTTDLVLLPLLCLCYVLSVWNRYPDSSTEHI